MMIIVYKCFFRKKTTKITILLLTLSFLILSILIIGRNNYINKANSNYKGSFLEINNVNNNDIKIIKKDINVNSYEIGFIVEDYYFFVGKNSLNKNEIILPNELIEEYKIGDNIEFELDNKAYNFVIKDFEDKSNYRFVINDTLYHNLSVNKEKFLRINIKNWSARENIAKKIEKKINKSVGTFTIKKDDINYDIIVNTFLIIISLFIVLFAILFFITLYNLIIDERKTNSILSSIGYSKNKILKLTIKKIILVISISFVVNLIIAIIFNLIKIAI